MIVGGYNTRTYKNLKKVALDSSIFSWIRTHIQRSAVSLIVAHSTTLEVCVNGLQEITKAIRVSGTHRNKKGTRSPMASGRLPEIDAYWRVLPYWGFQNSLVKVQCLTSPDTNQIHSVIL
jgi:hypothetical protein